MSKLKDILAFIFVMTGIVLLIALICAVILGGVFAFVYVCGLAWQMGTT